MEVKQKICFTLRMRVELCVAAIRRRITNNNPLSLQRKGINSPNRTIPSRDPRRAGNLNKIHELIFRGVFSKMVVARAGKLGHSRGTRKKNEEGI